jgi:methylenetetrahydrofolate dehydrogenase (NADP+)/methenyltetrahydrofolate cyclohydrolase
LDKSATESEVLDEVSKINLNPEVDGLIVQLPLPKHISEMKVTEAIVPEKDVDGFHPINIGRMTLNLPSFISATPAGIIELLDRYKIPTSGKHCVVIGRSNIVGSPMSILMARNTKLGNCTVTLTHSRTQNLDEICRSADILIVALGKVEFVTADMVKQGAVVVDVGITRVKSDKTKSGWKLLGDVDFDQVAPKCSYITPVPGGVGPMTIASLLKNTLLSSQNKIY